MTREEIEEARDLLKMIEVKEPNELIVNSWWGSFAKDYKEALQIAIKSLEKLQTISNLFSKWQNEEVDDNEYFFQMQNILLFGKTLESKDKEVSE